MASPAFRDTHTLSDAVELVGRRLYADQWDGLEYRQENIESPQVLAARRSPLERAQAGLVAELTALQAMLDKETNLNRAHQLRGRIKDVEARYHPTVKALDWDIPPINDATRSAYERHRRWVTALGLLLNAIQEREIIVHDGHGRHLSSSVWNNPRSRYSIELSLVVNASQFGEPRRQAARIDRNVLDGWLRKQKRLVEATPESSELQLQNYLREKVLSVEQGAARMTRDQYWKDASSTIPGVSKRMFERVWASATPLDWHKAGTRKRKSSQPQAWTETIPKKARKPR